MLKPFLRIGQIIGESAVGICLGKGGELIAVKELEVLKVRGIRQPVLGKNNMRLARAGFIEQGGDASPRIGSPHVDHARGEGTQDGIAIVEQLLRWPAMR